MGLCTDDTNCSEKVGNLLKRVEMYEFTETFTSGEHMYFCNREAFPICTVALGVRVQGLSLPQFSPPPQYVSIFQHDNKE